MMTSLNNLLSGYHNAESDWGIEEPPLLRNRFDSVSTSDYSQPPRIGERDSYKSRTLFDRSGSFSHVSSHDGYSLSVKNRSGGILPGVQATTENISKFIRKYLCFKTNSLQFIEKFKYNLIISNLLDDTLVQSKNEQALNNLLQIMLTEDGLRAHPPRLKKPSFYPGVSDDSYLQVTEKKFHLHIPRFEGPECLLNLLFLNIFLLKQSMKISSPLCRSAKVEIFKRLLLYSTKYVKSIRVNYLVESFKCLRYLNEFMISNCQMNKVVISSFITLRECDLFHSISKQPQRVSPDAARSHLNMLLDGMVVNIKASIRDCLIHTNGNLLEKYCEINNIPLGLVSESVEVGLDDKPEEHDTSTPLSTKALTEKLNVFNNLRRFFVCQLLTIHDGHSFNYLLLKLGHSFNINFASSRDYNSISLKLRSLNSIFDSHIAMLNQFLSLNEKFHSLHNPQLLIDYTNDNILSQPEENFPNSSSQTLQIDLFPSKRDINLHNLIDKLQNLTTNLKYYKTYFGQNFGAEMAQPVNDSGLTYPLLADQGDYEEKLAIFALFSSELKSSMDLYLSCLTDYKADGNRIRFSEGSSRSSTSKLNSCTDQFGLKSFHTIPSAHKKKSLTEDELAKIADKRKRFSSGLLGLLTVLEDAKDGEEGADTDKDAFLHQSYNLTALEALTKRMNLRGSHRFSMNSVNSNLSGLTDLIASTQFTTDDEELGKGEKTTSPPMNQEELRKKLEESLNKIYSLEAENDQLSKLAAIGPDETDPHDEPRDENGHGITSVAAKDGAFLGTLEKTFSANAGLIL